MDRIILLLFIFVIDASTAQLSVRGVNDDFTTEEDNWAYYVAPEPNIIKLHHKNVFPDGLKIKTLITDNPTIQILMEKAQKRSAKLEMRLLQWTDLVNSVANVEKMLKDYVDNHDKLESDTLVNYADWCVSLDSGSIKGTMEKIQNLVAPLFKHQGLIELIASFLEQDDKCDINLSNHQVILDVYNVLVQTEIHSYKMMQYSWQLLAMFNRGNFTQESVMMKSSLEQRLNMIVSAARSALLTANRDLYRCNPSSYDYETYAEVTRLLQGYIENEVDMNGDRTCKKNCAFYTSASNHGCFKDQYCARQPICSGRIINCQFVESDMTICPASTYSNRRYEYIEYESGKVLGKRHFCYLGSTKVDSWWRWVFWHCSYCMCLCDDASYNSHRYFSLRPALSDVEHNKVVAGVRLTKVNRVFHLQILQGTLAAQGEVTSQEGWHGLEEFDPSVDDVVEGIDYHTLSYESRGVELDTLDSPSGYVLTGVRFQKHGANLRLEIQATPFNYTTGKLDPEQSEWYNSIRYSRSRLNMYKPDVPTLRKDLSIDSSDGDYIQFTHTDFEADAAQTTVPFIDIQGVLPTKVNNMKSLSLNSGAGLYHRGGHGSGGFIGIKLRTYDYSDQLQAEELPEKIEVPENVEPLSVVRN